MISELTLTKQDQRAYTYKYSKTSTKPLTEKSTLRIINKFFGNLNESPKIMLPWLFISVVLSFSFFLIGDIEISFELENIIQGRLSDIEIGIARMALLVDKVLLWLNPLLIAAIGFLLLKNNYYISFRKVLALMLYGECLYYCGVLLSIPIVLLTGKSYPFSLAPVFLHFGNEPSGMMYFLSLKLDVFFVLQVLFVGIGVSKMTHCSLKHGFKVSLLSVGLLTMIMFFFKLLSEFSI